MKVTKQQLKKIIKRRSEEIKGMQDPRSPEQTALDEIEGMVENVDQLKDLEEAKAMIKRIGEALGRIKLS